MGIFNFKNRKKEEDVRPFLNDIKYFLEKSTEYEWIGNKLLKGREFNGDFLIINDQICTKKYNGKLFIAKEEETKFCFLGILKYPKYQETSKQIEISEDEFEEIIDFSILMRRKRSFESDFEYFQNRLKEYNVDTTMLEKKQKEIEDYIKSIDQLNVLDKNEISTILKKLNKSKDEIYKLFLELEKSAKNSSIRRTFQDWIKNPNVEKTMEHLKSFKNFKIN